MRILHEWIALKKVGFRLKCAFSRCNGRVKRFGKERTSRRDNDTVKARLRDVGRSVGRVAGITNNDRRA